MRLMIEDRSGAMSALVAPETELRTLGTGFGFTEGPVWLAAEKALLFNDIPGDTRWRWKEGSGMEVVQHPNFMGNGMVLDRDGGLLVCEHATSMLVRLKETRQREIVAYHYKGRYLNSPNDVITRSDGTIYFTDPMYGRMHHSHGIGRDPALEFRGVYMVSPGGKEAELVVAEHEFDQPNGLCFSPDETILYVDDLACIKAFPVQDDGRLGVPRVLMGGMASPDGPGHGIPDGMRCDETGNIWCAGVGGVWVITPAGELVGILRTPEVCANLVWGGDDWRTLFLCASSSVFSLPTSVRPAPLPYH